MSTQIDSHEKGESSPKRLFVPTSPDEAPPSPRKRIFTPSSPDDSPPPRRVYSNALTPEDEPPERRSTHDLEATAKSIYRPTVASAKVPSTQERKHVASSNLGKPEPIRKVKPNSSPQILLEEMVKLFWRQNVHDSSQNNKLNNEMEVRFGTMDIRRISKIDYDNVIGKLKSLGFIAYGPESGLYMLRAYPSIHGQSKEGENVRVELRDIHVIQEYCKTDNLNNVLDSHPDDNSVTFQRKNGYMYSSNERLPAVNFEDFNFRASYQVEEPLKRTSKLVESICENWTTSDKTYRYMNRISMRHPDYPIQVDFSITKSIFPVSKKKMRKVSEVFNAPEVYEIELEVINDEIGFATSTKTVEDLLAALRKVIKFVLMGLQRTNYPVSYREQESVIREYMKIIRGSEYNGSKPIYSSDFIGPGTVTLQIENICPQNPDILEPNIREGYTVTDKADGDRCILLVADNGFIYLITTNMDVIFTGAVTKNKKLVKSIIDGELIIHDRHGHFMNLYAAFDIYFLNGKNVRSHAFMNIDGGSQPSTEVSRVLLLNDFMQNFEAVSIVKETHSPMTFVAKEFRYSANIFDTCQAVLMIGSQLRYNTDGLIFTPAQMGVGADRVGAQGKLGKMTWNYSFKWKPPQYNTIDFLVTTVKDGSGSDKVMPIFQQGIDTSSIVQIKEYKTLILRCGYRDSDGYLNPCLDIINDNLPKKQNPSVKDDSNTYKPVQFFPTNPANPDAGIAKILLRTNGTSKNMFTESDELFEDNMIIEFRYDHDEPSALFRWKPLRVRYDKTSEFRQGKPNFGNPYFVANTNWKSIFNPVDINMLSTGSNIPDEIADDDIYYNKITKDTQTRGLRDFHNLFVKNLLITGVSQKGNTLLDFACGKGGDLAKWTKAELSFVFGIDISSDNLENRKNGSCVRYLDMYKVTRHMPDVLFVNGDSSLNIRSGQAMRNEKAIQITKTVFGSIRKDPETMGAAVLRQHDVGKSGFDVTSCQFAIHYFFESMTTLQNFVRNVAECTKINGYFIGTTYDGKIIFDRLNKTPIGESLVINHKDIKVWEVEKKYADTDFPADSSSLGFTVGVYQESIGKKMDEYLVNFEYLVRVMSNYGLSLISRDEAKQFGLPNATGLFRELYDKMIMQIRSMPSRGNIFGTASKMEQYEKDISFLNRYFVFKKTHVVNAEKISLESIGEFLPPSKLAGQLTEKAIVIAKNIPQIFAKKLNRKIRLVGDEDGYKMSKKVILLEEDIEGEIEDEGKEKFEGKYTSKHVEEGEQEDDVKRPMKRKREGELKKKKKSDKVENVIDLEE